MGAPQGAQSARWKLNRMLHSRALRKVESRLEVDDVHRAGRDLWELFGVPGEADEDVEYVEILNIHQCQPHAPTNTARPCAQSA